MGVGRRAGSVAAVAVLALGGLALVVERGSDGTMPERAGVVTVRAPAAPATPPSPPPPEMLLRPPVAPVLRDTMAVPGDAFVGEWRTPDGQSLSVAAERSGYGVTLGGERYDGVLKDGRIHFPRGIDGDWLQAAADAPCLYLGSGTRFCRR